MLKNLSSIFTYKTEHSFKTQLMLKKLFKYLQAKKFEKKYQITLQKLKIGKYCTNYLIFDSENKINEWSKRYIPSIDILIQNALQINDGYSTLDIIKCYCGYWAEKMNTILRHDYVHKDTSIYHEYIQRLSHELESYHLDTNIVAIRWIHFKHFRNCFGISFSEIKEDVNYIDKGFMSTSVLITYINKPEIGKFDFSNSILLILKIPKGTNCMYLEHEMISKRKEYELLLNKGYSIHISNIIYRFNHSGIILAEIV